VELSTLCYTFINCVDGESTAASVQQLTPTGGVVSSVNKQKRANKLERRGVFLLVVLADRRGLDAALVDLHLDSVQVLEVVLQGS
jgi:hypothetical protein